MGILAFSLDTASVNGIVEGLKEFLRNTAGTLGTEELKTVQNNLKMAMALKNFKQESDPILAGVVAQYVEQQNKLARILKGVGKA